MARDDEKRVSAGSPGARGGHVIDFGQLGPATSGSESGDGARPHRRWTRWPPIGLAACLAVAIGAHLATSRDGGVALPAPTPAST